MSGSTITKIVFLVVVVGGVLALIGVIVKVAFGKHEEPD